MAGSVLILGASGRFGRHAAQAFRRHGWQVRGFDRARDRLTQSAAGVDVIVNAWNPTYPDWAAQVPALHREVQEVAKAEGATVIVPGNVYVFGGATPSPWGPDTPHRAENPLGRIRREMEDSYRTSGVRTILLRAGDFIDNEASGNWFDRILMAKLARGKVMYPGTLDAPHAWAFLPDLAETAVQLAARRDSLERYTDVCFAGYTLTGRALAAAVSDALGQSVQVKRMSWMPIQLARPFWPLARHLLEMRYLWDVPHYLDESTLAAVLGSVPHTKLEEALPMALSELAPSVQNMSNRPVSVRN